MTDIELLEKWKKNQSQENTTKLLQHLEPRIDYAVRKFSTAGIPQSVLRVKAKALALEQCKTFRPGFGANLSTHVGNGLLKMIDYVDSEKDVVRIPNNIKKHIPKYIENKEILTDSLGRQPSGIEMADRLKISPNLVHDIETIINRKEIGESSSNLSPAYSMESKEHKAIMIQYYDIQDDKERLVYEYTFGIMGKPRMQVSQISLKTSVPEHTVRRIQKKNALKIKDYLG